MFEYGKAVGEGAGRANSAGGGGAPHPMDAGAAAMDFVNDSVHTISALPPGVLVAGFIVFVLGLIILKRAF
ncbi:MAG: hypothetical protein ACJ761_01840 [Chloroflexota bacterium]